MHDFGTGRMYSAIDVIIEKYKVTFSSAVKILRDVVKTLDTNKPLEKTGKDLTIEAVRKELDEETWYWSQYGISPHTLDKFQVHTLKAVYLNGMVS